MPCRARNPAPIRKCSPSAASRIAWVQSDICPYRASRLGMLSDSSATARPGHHRRSPAPRSAYTAATGCNAQASAIQPCCTKKPAGNSDRSSLSGSSAKGMLSVKATPTPRGAARPATCSGGQCQGSPRK